LIAAPALVRCTAAGTLEREFQTVGKLRLNMLFAGSTEGRFAQQPE
jgi:hypothetical protein